MIVEWLLDAIQAAIEFVLNLLPSGNEIPFIDNLNSLLSNLGAMNYFLPISETFNLVVGVFLVFPLLMGVSLSLWILAQVRGSSARG
jgi:hypothetical protein